MSSAGRSQPTLRPASNFATRVRDGFERQAGRYERGAELQRAVAWRLAHHCRGLPLPAGPCVDLGAGTGLLARAIEQQRPGLALLRLDNCAALLGLDQAADRLTWDLNLGLPGQLQGASLLVSSFALHWLEQPERHLERWCQSLGPAGWLALAVPTAGSFCQWRQAAQAAGLPCSALPLPVASRLVELASRHLRIERVDHLRFSRQAPSALTFLRQIRSLGAGTSPVAPLQPGEWRRIEAHWPAVPAAEGGGKRLSWEMLLLVGQKPAP
ncbi:SAM-dependent methyltransferase [Synechococcus sp. CS-602]|uniref:hypothetical protein n=1 Tax=Synechococcaceae TaxID=1890426 RepID=UPI0008FF101A|nr:MULTISPECIES: hypothetical protein [Synechococcaceae]MCT4363443.1 SAM-dependent methyltransferase [Candidatus Regnicoccus frigidus MAG-AL1]APD48480.1 hypothetical protein BM449_09860 [Synechococcus sp. SynAce01]MCT0203255.1 SAM-dependent methyltransferase [Synechococcus sp. CS-603]MCT0205265.1 SAM-dependent methyltransferase [Synechococcus sp. CS-602]MCT0246759.1 SAM-dependent methyltransferase [Synechococcus sp. CS-601]